MFEVSGFDGEIFFVSDPAAFCVYLEDCGDGFDWRLKEPLLWDDPAVEGFQDAWSPLEVDALYPSGRLSLHRCARGRVRARGVCRHLSLAARGRWKLQMDVQVSPEVLGGGRQTQRGACMAILSELEARVGFGPDLRSERLLARLRTPGGCFQGMGSVSDNGDVLHFSFEEGVTHGPL